MDLDQHEMCYDAHNLDGDQMIRDVAAAANELGLKGMLLEKTVIKKVFGEGIKIRLELQKRILKP